MALNPSISIQYCLYKDTTGTKVLFFTLSDLFAIAIEKEDPTDIQCCDKYKRLITRIDTNDKVFRKGPQVLTSTSFKSL